MDIRVLTYFLILFGAVIFDMISQRQIGFDKRKAYIFTICFVLALLSGLRHLVVGPDTLGYFTRFTGVKLISWAELLGGYKETFIDGTSKDPSYDLIQKIIQLLITEFTTYLLIVSAFFYISLGLFIYRNTIKLRDAVFAFTLYVALFEIIALSGIRQQIATAIAFFAYECIKRKNHVMFLLLVLLGSTIHISLLIIILLWGLSFLPVKQIKYLYFLPFLLLPIVFSAGRSIVLFMASFFANDYYAVYTETDNGGSAYTYIILAISVALFGLYMINNTIAKKRNNKIYFIAIGLMAFFVPLIQIDGALIRIGQYFSLYMMIFIPVLIDNLKTTRTYKISILFSLIIILIFFSLRVPFDYYFFWQTTPN